MPTEWTTCEECGSPCPRRTTSRRAPCACSSGSFGSSASPRAGPREEPNVRGLPAPCRSYRIEPLEVRTHSSGTATMQMYDARSLPAALEEVESFERARDRVTQELNEAFDLRIDEERLAEELLLWPDGGVGLAETIRVLGVPTRELQVRIGENLHLPASYRDGSVSYDADGVPMSVNRDALLDHDLGQVVQAEDPHEFERGGYLGGGISRVTSAPAAATHEEAPGYVPEWAEAKEKR